MAEVDFPAINGEERSCPHKNSVTVSSQNIRLDCTSQVAWKITKTSEDQDKESYGCMLTYDNDMVYKHKHTHYSTLQHTTHVTGYLRIPH